MEESQIGTGCTVDYTHNPSAVLSDLAKGETALIERFSDLAHVRKFLSLGILPGTSITVLKQSPAVVLRVGYSEFAFDRRLAGTVQVRRMPGK
ncbi:MAG: ferrous iron transport protein A [Candidatus Sumerlaeaceae bacterium]|nr:ferrous iron transport protein A [Candidatus Sumerlaeaceae bacterium]